MGSEGKEQAVLQTESIRELTCICCPVGCTLKAQKDGQGNVSITGNKCPRGAAYGQKELTDPTRIVTSTVRVSGRDNTVVAVKTATDIPKGKIEECMKELALVTVTPPVEVGDIVLRNVADTGVDIVVTRPLA